MNTQKARQIKRKRHRFIALCVVFVLAVCAVVLLRSVFVLRDIQITGNSYFARSEIIRKAKITPGGSIFAVSEERIRRAFDEEGAVQLTDVKVILPDGLQITVRESTPHAVASFAGMLVVLDEYGYVIEKASSATGYAVPAVNGLEMQLCSVGRRIECATAGMLQSYCDVIGAVYETGLQQEISEINLYNLDSITLATRTGFVVKAGDRKNMEMKLRLMQVCLNDQVKQGKTSGRIDVSSDKAAYYSEK